MAQRGGAVPTTAALLGDDTSQFFLRDASLRLTRSVELALAYLVFIALLYCRFLAPGGLSGWQWFEQSGLWVLVFMPLFVLDSRNFRHISYLNANAARFAPHDAKRYFLIAISECSYKVMLCLWLSIAYFQSLMSLQVVMLPYGCGYILHFVLGHFVPLEEGERAEGCNAVASLLSELGRFLQFVLVVSMSLKVDSASNVEYNWQAAFWPCWGLEGIIILVVVLLLPVCIVSIVVDRPRMLMLTWIVMSAVGVGVSSFMSMYNIANLLDQNLCPETPCQDGASSTCALCRDHLEKAILPWLTFLPAFCIATTFLKARLAVALHNAWYQAAPEARGGAAQQREPALPPPVVMFRVTPTFYTRACDPALLDLDGMGTSIGPASVVLNASTPVAAVAALSGVNARSRASFGSVGSSLFMQHRGSIDHHTSILSARGSVFADIVESECLCYICFDNPPGAAILECGHAGMCVNCAEYLMGRPVRQAKCPICRGPISNAVRLREDLALPRELFTVASRRLSNESGRSENWSPDASQSVGTQGLGLLGTSVERPSSSFTESMGVSSGVVHSASCDPERGDSRARLIRATSKSRLMTVAQAAADGCGQPLAAPPYPATSKKYAVVVESLRRTPGTERPAWRLASLLGTSTHRE